MNDNDPDDEFARMLKKRLAGEARSTEPTVRPLMEELLPGDSPIGIQKALPRGSLDEHGRLPRDRRMPGGMADPIQAASIQEPMTAEEGRQIPSEVRITTNEQIPQPPPVEPVTFTRAPNARPGVIRLVDGDMEMTYHENPTPEQLRQQKAAEDYMDGAGQSESSMRERLMAAIMKAKSKIPGRTATAKR